MAKISVYEFIKELDSHFAREDLAGAGECVLKWREKAREIGDRSGELSVLNEMIGYYRRTGEEQPALNAVKEAFDLIDELDIGSEVTAATIYLNGATTMKAFGRSAEAMPYYELTYKIYRSKLPERDPLFAGLYNNMALALQDNGEFNGARECFRRAIDITSSLPRQELETAISCVNLAHLLYDKEPEDAEIMPLLDRASAILRDPAVFGYDNYAFTCRKCAPSFGFFGLFLEEKYLNERADEVYAGS